MAERVLSGYEGETNMTLYAESEGQLVGMMGAIWSTRIKTGHIATIYGVYVTLSMRGKGVGLQLMQSLLDELANIPQITKVKLAVTVTQSSAQALYAKFGFETIGIAKRELKINGHYYDEILMEKLL